MVNLNTTVNSGTRFNDGAAGLIGFYHSGTRRSTIWGQSAGQIEIKATSGQGVFLKGGAYAAVQMATNVNTSGSQAPLRVLQTYSQASGTAANTDILVNRTETAVGSGEQNLIDLQVASASKFRVDNTATVESDKGTADEPFWNFKATADADATSAISTNTTSGATTHHVQIEINGVTAWIAVSTTDPT